MTQGRDNITQLETTTLENVDTNQKEIVLKTKITKLNNLIESFQKKLVIETTNIPCLKKFHYSDGDYDIKIKNNFETLFNEIYLNNKGTICIGNDYISNRNFVEQNLFTIKNIFTKDNYYIFEGIDGSFFNALINDFDKNGIKSKSLNPGKPDSNIKVTQLVAGNIINNENKSIQVLDTNNKVISTIVGEYIDTFDKDLGNTLVVNNNLFEYINIEQNGNHYQLGDSIKHNYGEIKQLKIDNYGNFALIISEYELGNKKLHILNRKTLEELKTFDDINQILLIDDKNDLVCIDKDGITVNIDTNFDQFPKGYVDNNKIGEHKITEIQNLTHKKLEDALISGTLDIDPNNLQNQVLKNNLESPVKILSSKLWEIKIGENTLKELFEESTTQEQIDLVYKAFHLIKTRPDVGNIPGITDEIEKEINNKNFEIKLNILKSELTEIKELLDKNNNIENLLYLKNKLDGIKKSRSQIPLLEENLDKDISEISDTININIEQYRINNQGETLNTIKKSLDQIKIFLDSINYLTQVTNVFDTDIYEKTMHLIDLLDDDKKIDYSNKLQTLITNKIEELEKLKIQEEKKSQNQLNKKINDIENDIENFGKIIGSLEDENAIEVIKYTDILYKKIITSIDDLSSQNSDKLKIKLNKIIDRKKQEIRISKLGQKGVIHNLDEYGIDTSLYFVDKNNSEIGYKLIGHRQANGNLRLELKFDNGTTFDFDKYLQSPDLYSQYLPSFDFPTEMNQSDFLKLQKNIANWKKIGKDSSKKDAYKQARWLDIIAKKIAKGLNINPRPNLEIPDNRFIVLSEEKELLEKMSAGFNIQLTEQKGIDILEGAPGLGKTEICKFFAAVTNREIIRIQCSKMDPSDLFFSPQLKAGETTREPAEWIKLMKKPGTLILFDEIDKLNQRSFERLHSLFDGARSIYDPQIGSIKANPDCLFAGARNSYELMSNPIVSRSTIIQINAPSEINEAYKISKYTKIEYFEKLNYEDFCKLYDSKNTNNDLESKKIYELLGYIKGLVGIFSELRVRQSSDNYDEKYCYELSYRDAMQIFSRYNNRENIDFIKIVKEVLIPKARAVVYENDEKDIQEEITNSVIDNYLK